MHDIVIEGTNHEASPKKTIL